MIAVKENTASCETRKKLIKSTCDKVKMVHRWYRSQHADAVMPAANMIESISVFIIDTVPI